MAACPEGNPEFSLVSTDPWQTAENKKQTFSCGVIHGNVKAGKFDVKVPLSISGGIANLVSRRGL